jgi:hypothetical protein
MFVSSATANPYSPMGLRLCLISRLSSPKSTSATCMSLFCAGTPRTPFKKLRKRGFMQFSSMKALSTTVSESRIITCCFSKCPKCAICNTCLPLSRNQRSEGDDDVWSLWFSKIRSKYLNVQYARATGYMLLPLCELKLCPIESRKSEWRIERQMHCRCLQGTHHLPSGKEEAKC